MSDNNKRVAKIIFLTGRIDGCENLITELQGRIEQDQRKIELLKQPVDETRDVDNGLAA